MEDKKSLLITSEEITQIFKKRKRKENSRYILIKLFREIFLMFFVFIISFSILNWPAVSQNIRYWWYIDYRNNISLSPNPRQPIIPTKSQLVISKIDVKAPIIWDIPSEQIHNQLRNGVVHYANTAHPDEIGNVFIVGHSSDYIWSKGKYKNVFSLIGKLKAGDTITLNYQNQQYIYEVFDSAIIRPNDTSVLKPTDKPIITLMTCYPIGSTARRLVVKAKLLSPILVKPQIKTIEPITLPKAR